ncbi:hypothetical protein ULMS_24010 [Patiriisocius marinistellae]|uniref:Uncharacterized protein n=1 Tax=Patiriisocius marinistellae TaxID=2494560 RepID=A0A5J4FXW9_9FLAO|nr:hypothetical protein [Patiriisocius marinistellae]GEQ86893.1 hypothetical protein ULMS_24010 [Patiriisocius marinistellae]
MKNILWVFILLLTIPASFGQGAIDGFFKEKGSGSIVLGAGFEDTKNYFAGNTRTDISRSLYYGSLFGAYGVTNNFDVNVSVPFLSSNDNTSFQDISIYAKYKVATFEKNNFKYDVGVAGGFSTPLTDYDVGGLNDIGQQATVVSGRILIHVTYDFQWFATLQTGYAYKFDEVPESLLTTLKLGKATSKWYYDVFFDYQHSFGGIDYLGTPQPQNFKEFGVDFKKVGGTVFHSFNKQWGGYLSLGYVINGRNVFQGPSYGIGAVYNFKRVK